ncbi:MAG: hypothetical protein J6X62_02665 [Bacteroidales bacterium]|nr:hypothetical protein [Bacteroidales bacterium]
MSDTHEFKFMAPDGKPRAAMRQSRNPQTTATASCQTVASLCDAAAMRNTSHGVSSYATCQAAYDDTLHLVQVFD